MTAAMAAIMATEAPARLSPILTTSSRCPSRRRRASTGADWMAVALFSVATFLVVLTLLSRQLATTSLTGARSVHVLRKIYRTTVVEMIAGGSGSGGTSVSQSVSNSAASTPVAPATRTS